MSAGFQAIGHAVRQLMSLQKSVGRPKGVGGAQTFKCVYCNVVLVATQWRRHKRVKAHIERKRVFDEC